VPKERWPAGDAIDQYLGQHWQNPYGDRRQELVFIGSGIDWPALKARLDAALLADEDYAVETPPNLHDPFALWRRADEN
jgi:hypothetical protein